MGTFPNPDTQFKPGQSGNPNGLPKGTKHISTWIQEMLNDETFDNVIEDQNGKRVEFKGAPLKAIIMTAVVKANKGDNRWADWLAKYGYGTKVQLSNDPENPINSDPVSKTLLDAFLENVKADVNKQARSDSE